MSNERMTDEEFRERLSAISDDDFRRLKKSAKQGDLLAGGLFAKIGMSDEYDCRAALLYTLHPFGHERGGNIGYLLGLVDRRMRGDRPRREEEGPTEAERRFNNLLRNGFRWTDLVTCFRTANQRLGAEVAINYHQLAADLREIDTESRNEVVLRWATAFWQ